MIESTCAAKKSRIGIVGRETDRDPRLGGRARRLDAAIRGSNGMPAPDAGIAASASATVPTAAVRCVPSSSSASNASATVRACVDVRDGNGRPEAAHETVRRRRRRRSDRRRARRAAPSSDWGRHAARRRPSPTTTAASARGGSIDRSGRGRVPARRRASPEATRRGGRSRSSPRGHGVMARAIGSTREEREDDASRATAHRRRSTDP